MRCKWTLLLFFAASLGAADLKPPPWEKSPLIAGRNLFRANCAVCHDIDKDQAHTRKLGPSLNHLFTNAKLPLSHGKPSRPYVVVRIKFGGALMPAFRAQLSDSEVNTLVDYIASK
jgi:mono/diheme cytochrome c family protein